MLLASDTPAPKAGKALLSQCFRVPFRITEQAAPVLGLDGLTPVWTGWRAPD